MATLRIDGLDGLVSDMTRLAVLPESVLNQMLIAGAAVVGEEQKRSALSYGVYDTGQTKESIRATNPKHNADGAYIAVYPQGMRAAKARKTSRRKKNRRTSSDQTRNAEVAFINEYGKKGQAARPFIHAANEKAAQPAAEAEQEALNRFVDSLGL